MQENDWGWKIKRLNSKDAIVTKKEPNLGLIRKFGSFHYDFKDYFFFLGNGILFNFLL